MDNTIERKYSVYIHKNKINGKIYVGITCQEPTQRWGKNGSEYGNKNVFGKAIHKYGWDNFKHIVLYKNFTEEEAKWKERFLIKLHNSKIPYGYNMTDGGDGVVGIIWTDKMKEKQSKIMKEIMNKPDVRDKLSKSHKGFKPSKESIEKSRKSRLGLKRSDDFREKMKTARIGYKHSEETKKKISEIQKGRPLTDRQKKHLEEMSKNNIGRKHTKETREKISKASTGRKLSEEAKRKISEKNKGYINIKERIPVVQLTKSKELIKIFDSIVSANIETGIQNTNIVKVCKGKRNTAGGYCWMYYDDYININQENQSTDSLLSCSNE